MYDEKRFMTYFCLPKDATIHPEDEVLIRAKVIRTIAFSPNVLVELFSKTDQYEAWIRRDHILMLAASTDVPEPEDKSWVLQGDEGSFDGVFAFCRSDVGAPLSTPNGPRRDPAHWFSVGSGQWMTWDMVIREIGTDFIVVPP